jgi:hypothetical protein
MLVNYGRKKFYNTGPSIESHSSKKSILIAEQKTSYLYSTFLLQRVCHNGSTTFSMTTLGIIENDIMLCVMPCVMMLLSVVLLILIDLLMLSALLMPCVMMLLSVVLPMMSVLMEMLCV